MSKLVFFLSLYIDDVGVESFIRNKANDPATLRLIATMDRLKEIGISYSLKGYGPVFGDHKIYFDTTDEGWIVYKMMGNTYGDK